MGLEAARERGQSGTADTGRALRRDEHEQQQRDLLADRQRVAQGFGDEDRSHRQIDHRAVEVEGVAGRHGDSDDGLADAQVFHLRDEPRQCRLGRGRGEDQQELTAQIPQQGKDVEPGEQPQHRSQYDEDEDEAGDVEAEHDDREGLQRVQPRLTHHGGDGAERTDGRRPHDHREHAEDQPLEMADAAEYRLTRGSHRLEREADEQGHQQRLEHLALREGGHQRRGDDAEQELRRPLARSFRLLGARVAHGVRQLQTVARLQHVADDQSDAESDDGHRQEVAEREAAHRADLRRLTHRADAQHDGDEDDRRDHHRDERDEALTERLQLLGRVGRGEADEDAEQDGTDHGQIEVLGAVPLRRRGTSPLWAAVSAGTRRPPRLR